MNFHQKQEIQMYSDLGISTDLLQSTCCGFNMIVVYLIMHSRTLDSSTVFESQRDEQHAT